MDEIWDLIESVSEGFPPYSYGYQKCNSWIPVVRFLISTILFIEMRGLCGNLLFIFGYGKIMMHIRNYLKMSKIRFIGKRISFLYP